MTSLLLSPVLFFLFFFYEKKIFEKKLFFIWPAAEFHVIYRQLNFKKNEV